MRLLRRPGKWIGEIEIDTAVGDFEKVEVIICSLGISC